MSHHDVFISHSSEDKPIADAICAELESQNIRCWIAPRDILPGKDFQEAIIDGLNESKLFIFVFSSNANQSPHAQRELSQAAHKKITILPFRTEDVNPCKTIEYILTNIHWLDAMTPPLKKHLKVLAEKVKLNLLHEGDTHPLPPIDRPVDISSNIKIKNTHAKKRIAYIPILLILLSGLAGALFLLGYIEFSKPLTEVVLSDRSPNNKSQWETDPYVGLRIPERISGTLTTEENYDINLEVKNQTSMQMYISKIVVEKYNKTAAKLFGMRTPLVHVGIAHGPFSLDAHEIISVKIVGNQILPNRLKASIFHNLSGGESILEFNTGAVELKMPAPRVLADKWIHKGMDGLLAIKQTRAIAQKWSPDAHIFAAFPGGKEDYLDDDTTLKVSVIKNWVVTFYSPAKDSFLSAVVADKILDQQVYHRKKDDAKPENMALPKIGNQEALAIANKKRSLCANWNGPRLNSLQRGERYTPAWFLSYRGPDAAPVIVNAITGKLEGINEIASF